MLRFKGGSVFPSLGNNAHLIDLELMAPNFTNHCMESMCRALVTAVQNSISYAARRYLTESEAEYQDRGPLVVGERRPSGTH